VVALSVLLSEQKADYQYVSPHSVFTRLSFDLFFRQPDFTQILYD
jgi:hypothetical protein